VKIGINGLFLDRPHTGSGQYTRHLLAALAKLNGEHEYRIFTPSPVFDRGGPGWGSPSPAGGGGDGVSHATDSYPEDATNRHRRFELQACDNPSWLGWGLPLGENGRKLWFEQVGLQRACRRAQVQLVHYPYFAAPLLKPCRVVVTIHDLITLLLPEYRRSLAVRLYNRLIVRAARHAEAIIADSQHTKDDIVRHLGIPAERVHVVYLAAEARFHPLDDADALAAVRQRYGLGERFVFYIGGLNRHKNVEALLAAFAAIRDRLPGIQLAIAGVPHSADPAIFPDLGQVARELGLPVVDLTGLQRPVRSTQRPATSTAVRFLGFVPEEDKALLYNAATLFVFPSRYEGFGLPPLEAMACGTPVIAARAASLPEVVGDGGLLIAPDDVAGLAQAMLAVLSDPARQAELRARGLAQAARFSWAQTARETLAVYDTTNLTGLRDLSGFGKRGR
jgi:glycosyltransferase involved in cell wall biosynthesis